MCLTNGHGRKTRPLASGFHMSNLIDMLCVWELLQHTDLASSTVFGFSLLASFNCWKPALPTKSNQVQPSSTRVIEQLVEDLLDVSNVARLPHDLYKLDLVNALHLEKCDETDGIRIRAELIKFWEYNNLLDGIFKQSFACHRYIIWYTIWGIYYMGNIYIYKWIYIYNYIYNHL